MNSAVEGMKVCMYESTNLAQDSTKTYARGYDDTWWKKDMTSSMTRFLMDSAPWQHEVADITRIDASYFQDVKSNECNKLQSRPLLNKKKKKKKKKGKKD